MGSSTNSQLVELEALDASASVAAPEPAMSGRGKSALSPGRRVVYVLLLGLWLIVNVRFWAFWLAPDHRGALALWIPATFAFAYLPTGLPAFYWFYVGRMRRPREVRAPPGLRVAMITLCVPRTSRSTAAGRSRCRGARSVGEKRLRSRSGVDQNPGEEVGECIVLIERKHMRDVLVWADDNDAASLAVDAPQVEDVTGGRVWAEHSHLSSCRRGTQATERTRAVRRRSGDGCPSECETARCARRDPGFARSAAGCAPAPGSG